MRKLKTYELNRLSVDEFKKTDKIPLIIVLDNIRSMNNIGSFFRTADAFKVQEIILCGITATPPHKDIHKTALGATDSVDWRYFERTEDAVSELKEQGYIVASIEQVENSVSINDMNITNPIAVVFGNEVKGVDQNIIDMSDTCIEIPQYGTKHSLNVSVCGGVVIWEIFKKMCF
ncbi:MAG: RNA methyltransferase [Bacteroidales bacterium]|jgi:tRNA G18 (ribose-2'-O)-methylase SpoU|nr:RNA methyltransferase [Bacteroidales bacterium]